MLKAVLHIANLTALASFILLALLTTPSGAGRIVLFFTSVALFVITSSVLAGLYIAPDSKKLFYTSLRSGILWAFFIIGVLLLGIFDALNIFIFLAFAVLIAAFELYLHAKNSLWAILKKLKKN